MIIKDLFSHKIHSSESNWANKLIDLAFIFAEFDHTPYNRAALENRLAQISPRASMVARDISKFRDEISAYPAYLGLYRVEMIDNTWHFVLSETSKRFLVTEEPDVATFMLLQLILFQYPNGMGIAYSSGSSNARLQANTWSRTQNFITNGVHLSPLRLICQTIKAYSIISGISIFQVSVEYDEIFALANNNRIYSYSNPPTQQIIEGLENYKSGIIQAPLKYENRFHILKHTDFFIPGRNSIRLRAPLNAQDEEELIKKFECICSTDIDFRGFDQCYAKEDLLQLIKSGQWGKYFDGIRTLNANTVQILAANKGVLGESVSASINNKTELENLVMPTTYPFRKMGETLVISTDNSNHSLERRITDPEATRIKRQRSNLHHKIVLQQLEDYLLNLGCEPSENEHIDLFAIIPNDGKFLFEVKSISSENLLSQTRKGVSQLYEYRFRYQNQIGYDVNLCLVFSERPTDMPWIEDYLCNDRQIGLIWFDNNNRLCYPEQGKFIIESLLQ